MNGDVLSDVLRAIRLTGAVYFDYELTSPWVAEAPPAAELSKYVMPGSDRLIEYHVIARGSCWGHRVGDEPIRLREGDILVFPQGDPHVLSSYPGMRAEPDMSAFVQRTGPLPWVFETGGGGPERARVVCGFLGCDDRPFNPLLAALPNVMHVSAASRPSMSWLRPVIETAVNESRQARAGSENVLARLSELMFVQVVREHLEALPAGEGGWLAALRDPVRQQGPGRAARRAGAGLDARIAGARSRRVAFGACRSFRHDGRATADAIPRELADAARVAAPRRRGRGRHRRDRRLATIRKLRSAAASSGSSGCRRASGGGRARARRAGGSRVKSRHVAFLTTRLALIATGYLALTWFPAHPVESWMGLSFPATTGSTAGCGGIRSGTSRSSIRIRASCPRTSRTRTSFRSIRGCRGSCRCRFAPFLDLEHAFFIGALIVSSVSFLLGLKAVDRLTTALAGRGRRGAGRSG